MLKSPFATLALVALAAAPALAQTIPATTPRGTMDDQAAALYIMMDSVGEVQACRLAQQKAQSQAVKSYCSQMISDHTKLAGAAQRLAQRLGAPSTKTQLQPNEESKVELAHLNGYRGHQFDEEFMQAQVEDHRNDITLLRDAMEGSTNAQAKAFDQQTLSQLTNHLKLANDTYNEVEAQSKSGG